jgi:hypothetical protein
MFNENHASTGGPIDRDAGMGGAVEPSYALYGVEGQACNIEQGVHPFNTATL